MTSEADVTKIQQAANDAFILLYQAASKLTDIDAIRVAYIMSAIHMITRQGFRVCDIIGMPRNDAVQKHINNLIEHEMEKPTNETH